MIFPTEGFFGYMIVRELLERGARICKPKKMSTSYGFCIPAIFSEFTSLSPSWEVPVQLGMFFLHKGVRLLWNSCIRIWSSYVYSLWVVSIHRIRRKVSRKHDMKVPSQYRSFYVYFEVMQFFSFYFLNLNQFEFLIILISRKWFIFS